MLFWRRWRSSWTRVAMATLLSWLITSRSSCTGYLGRPFQERKKMGVNEEQEESSLVGRMLIELVSSGSLAEQEARLHTQLGPRGCVPRSPLDREQGKRKKTCPRLLAGLGQI